MSLYRFLYALVPATLTLTTNFIVNVVGYRLPKTMQKTAGRLALSKAKPNMENADLFAFHTLYLLDTEVNESEHTSDTHKLVRCWRYSVYTQLLP